MSSLFSNGNPLLNPLLFNNFGYKVGLCSALTQPKTLEEFVASENQLLRGTAVFTVDFERIIRLKTNHDLTGINGTYTPTFLGVIIYDKSTDEDLALLVIEPFTEGLTPSNNLETVVTLNMLKDGR